MNGYMKQREKAIKNRIAELQSRNRALLVASEDVRAAIYMNDMEIDRLYKELRDEVYNDCNGKVFECGLKVDDVDFDALVAGRIRGFKL